MSAPDEETIAALREWKKSLNPLRVDIVGDFAGKGLFAIHGESLVAHCIARDNVDYLGGYQLLHAVHAVEVFLSKLKDRGCNFHIIWFDSHQDLAVPPDALHKNAHKYMLTRAVLVEHLRHLQPASDTNPVNGDLDAPMSFVFPSIASDEFHQYTSQYYLHFVMLSHGRSSESRSNLETQFLVILHLLAQHGYSLAFINDVEFRSSKAYAHIATPSRFQTSTPLHEPSTVSRPDLGCRYISEQLKSQSHPQKGQRQGRVIDAREEVAIVACASILSAKPTVVNEQRVAAFLAHVALLKHTRLSERSWACQIQQVEPLGYDEFLEDFSNIAATLVEQRATFEPGRHTNWKVCDLVDGRLYRQVLDNIESLRLAIDIRSYTQVIKDLVGVDVQRRRHLGYYARKKNQRYMADTIAYSASLTNASGKNINPESIVVTQEQSPVKTKTALTIQKRNKKQAGKSGKVKALEEAQKLKAEKTDTRSTSIVKNWDEKCRNFEREQSIKHYSKVVGYLANLSETDKQAIGGEVHLYVCKVLSLELICRTPSKPFSDAELSILAMVWSQVMDMRTLPLTTRTREQLKHLVIALKVPHSVLSDISSSLNRPLPFVSAYDISTSHVKVQTSGREFQLSHCGPYLERSFDSASDSRVPFSPDAWQRKVLDAIDAGKSLFVVAPTSAGKTFISFYAMKKILQANDDDVLVYVAPTKALVNQIAAEVQARFSKSYHHEGRSVWAIHTRDYRVNNPTGCQVLVTVPHVLQIMLMAPSNAQNPNSWARRVKRIIFDEVHCIGQAEDGIIWEQLLLLAPCPIIALSATVGNPLEFKQWLAGTQKAKGFDLEMIVHSTRYSDLRKFLYQPPIQQEFKGLDPVERLPIPGLDAETGDNVCFAFVHPIGSIVNKTKDTLNDASLEPRDCLRLWKAMTNNQTETHKVEENLNPELSLPNLIKKSDIVEWESALKKQLWQWTTSPKSPILNVYDELKTQTRSRNIVNIPSESTESAKIAGVISSDTLSLLVDLRSRGALPAILFNYDRVGCEKILFKLLQLLEDAEQKYRDNNPKWAKTMVAYIKWKEAQDSKAAKKGAKASKINGTTNSREDVNAAKDSGAAMTHADFARDDANREISPWESFDPEASLPQFSFADTAKITQEELEERIRSLGDQGIRPTFIHALRRGLAVHHAGMNRQYRQVVEMLFRKGYLTAVTATGTLALGLNMPCKTVVFAGDSVFLTALNYRQASGRAGRRGFDLLGNVVFHGIPEHRAMEIISSRLPDLRGQFPISVTLILRLFGLLHGTKDSEYAIKAVESLLMQTRLFLGGPASQMTVKHHVRFSIEYLRRQRLLSSNGVPLNFSGLVSHLYFTENAVFALHSLLMKGYLHELCKNIDRAEEQRTLLLTLMTVLCHLFCRIPCTKYRNQEWLEKAVHRSPSIVLLPALPPKAAHILKAHNEETLKIFRTYVHTFVDQHLSHAPDDELPFTKTRVGPAESEFVNTAAANISFLPPTVIRSPFAALSGFTDNFNTIHELCETVRAGVFLDESAIPYIPVYPHETNNVPWNAYIYDFFKHGDLEALVRDNGIKRGDVWFRLKDFSLILATIVTSLENFLGSNDVDDADMVDVQDVVDILEEERFGDDVVQQSSGAPRPTPETSGLESKAISRKGRQRVADSWEDESDSDEATEESPDQEHYPSSTDEGSVPFAASWVGDDGKSLVKVYKAFKLLQQGFDERFRKVWA
ncbi:putative helicase [Colletotrichum higginsianum]|uniref:Putative helicase n=1 Tax=Colletotrichum higginsianum TaxID=80884 RepID=A0A4T0W040_9PEZI|nr:putative helicase [Colletotrichum higginsianum]